MLCEEIKRAVYFFLDGELESDRYQAFSSHLTACPECGHRAELQRRLRGFFRKRIERISAPGHLKTRLSRSLRAFRNEWTREASNELRA